MIFELYDRTYRVLTWLLNKILYLLRGIDIRVYANNFHRGPVPVGWRVREGLANNQAQKDSAFKSNVLVGIVKQPSIRIKDDKHNIDARIPTPDVEGAWGDDSWLRADEDKDLQRWTKNV
jgi:hypothetical protein